MTMTLENMHPSYHPLQLPYPVSLASERNSAIVSGRFVNHIVPRSINPFDAVMKKIKRMIAIVVKCAVAFVFIWLILGLRGFLVVFLLWYVFEIIDQKLKR